MEEICRALVVCICSMGRRGQKKEQELTRTRPAHRCYTLRNTTIIGSWITRKLQEKLDNENELGYAVQARKKTIPSFLGGQQENTT